MMLRTGDFRKQRTENRRQTSKNLSSVFSPLSSVRGFSLIEMMVVLGIIALIVGMSLPYFGRFSSGSGIRAAARQISSLLYTGRSLAITHRKPYAVVFNVSDGEVTIQDAASSETGDKRYHIPTAISLENPDGLDPVSFKDDRVIFTPTGGVAGETGTLWLKDRKNNTVSITVHQSTGRIKINCL